MKKTDMELQAIRDKLQLLQAEPPAAEALSLPWSTPKSSEINRSQHFEGVRQNSQQSTYPSAHQLTQQPAKQLIKQSPQALAIEALKQRSSNTLGSVKESAELRSQAQTLIAQEIYRLEVQAHNINLRSQQQADEILTMKRSAQQAAVALGRQGIHGHPQLAIISELFDSAPSAVVPHIERDAQGNFSLTYETIDFCRAQQEAVDTAKQLRQLSQHNVQQRPFAEPNTSSTSKTTRVRSLDIIDHLTSMRRKHRRKGNPSLNRPALDTGLNSSNNNNNLESSQISNYPADGFSWLDAAIWFSGAAIARIFIELIVVNYPILGMPILVTLTGSILFVIYRLIISKFSDFSYAYRLVITMLGLFSAGLF